MLSEAKTKITKGWDATMSSRAQCTRSPFALYVILSVGAPAAIHMIGAPIRAGPVGPAKYSLLPL